jgi:hypothetical protein
LWFLTAYIIAKLAPVIGKKVNDSWELCKEDLIEFIFSKLWKKRGVALNDSIEELEGELRYLEKISLIERDGRIIIITEDLSRKIIEKTKKDPWRKKIPILDAYIREIDESVREINRDLCKKKLMKL